MAASRKSKLQVANTSFVSGEGKADRLFLEYLKSLYTSRDSGHKITVHKNNKTSHSGGSTIDVIKETMTTSANKGRSYDAFVCLLDKDIAGNQPHPALYKAAKAKCSSVFKHSIPRWYRFIFAEPCLEGLYLQILQGSRPSSTSACKELFEKLASCSAEEMDSRRFGKLLPKNAIDCAISLYPSLGELVEFFCLHGGEHFYDWFYKAK